MSQSRAPIHYLMWDRIKLVRERDSYIGQRVAGELGQQASEIIAEARRKHGFEWDPKPLEEQVGSQSIHAFLQDKVDRVETSEAALIGAVDQKFGAQGRKLLEESYYRHGKEFGARLIREAGGRIGGREGGKK